MIAFPKAKINVGLRIIDKRDDGYHNIESHFMKIPLFDILEVIPIDGSEMELTLSGIELPGSGADNLLFKVYDLVAEKRQLPAVKCHLHKQIPVGAGLGGGSSDAAEFAKLLNEMFELGLSMEELSELLVKVGSDCPFFLHDSPMFVTGTGDAMEPSNMNLSGMHIVLMNPGIHVSTIEAYKTCVPSGINLSKDFNGLGDDLINDFERSVFELYPEIERWKQLLLDQGARYAAMSGSGATVYGLFDSRPELPVIDSWHWTGIL